MIRMRLSPDTEGRTGSVATITSCNSRIQIPFRELSPNSTHEMARTPKGAESPPMTSEKGEPLKEESEKERIERLGRQRPPQFKSLMAEILFVYSILASQFMAVSQPSLCHSISSTDGGCRSTSSRGSMSFSQRCSSISISPKRQRSGPPVPLPSSLRLSCCLSVAWRIYMADILFS